MHKRGITSSELCKNYKDDKFLVVVDRSRGKKTYYTLAAIKRIDQYKLLRYADRFKHVRKLGKRSRQIYFPVALAIIKKLRVNDVVKIWYIGDNFPNLLKIIQRLDLDKVEIFLVDNHLIKPLKRIVEADLIIGEGELEKRRRFLRKKEISISALRTLMNIADTLANYIRIQVEKERRPLSYVLRSFI